MGYDWTCNTGCTYNERHTGHCSTLNAEEKIAVGVVRACIYSKEPACPFCKVQFAHFPPELHPEDCTLRTVQRVFWTALPYILK